MRVRDGYMARPGSWAAGAVLAAAVMAAAGCSSSSSSSSGSTQPAAPASSANGGYGAASSSAPASAAAATVKTGTSSLGANLTDATGRALYLFEKDAGGKSACDGACAQGWPPLLTTGTPAGGAGASASLLGTVKRADGTLQVTYAGHPLYYFVGDTNPGDIKGEDVQAFGAGWYLVSPAGKKIEKPGA
jgi:predicted lipoprotein with Yx(FWY)xxD motif